MGSVLGILLIVLALSAYMDVARHTISNRLVAVLMLLGFASQAWEAGWPGLYLAFIGCLGGLLPMLLIHAITGLGAGDVKLMAAVGAIVGLRSILAIWIYSYLISGIVAIAILTWRYVNSVKLTDGSIAHASTRWQWELPLAPGIALASAYVLWPQLSQAMHI